jgi:hypothetical protein
MRKLTNSASTFIPLDVGLAAGTTTTLTLGAVGPYCIEGKAYTQAAVANVQPSIIDLVTGVTLVGINPGYGAVIIVGATSSESATLRMCQGKQIAIDADTTDYTPGAFINPPQFPTTPDDFCPMGYILVRVATDYTSGSSYIFGSSNTTATGAQAAADTAHANTFVSVMDMPDRPQTS